MKMKINLNAVEKIEAALAAVNGKAARHTYTDAVDLKHVAERAETELERLGLAKAYRAGARVVAESGEKLPGRYKYQATTTTVTLERGSNGWFLVAANSSTLWPQSAPTYRLALTPKQDQIVVERFRSQYAVQPQQPQVQISGQTAMDAVEHV